MSTTLICGWEGNESLSRATGQSIDSCVLVTAGATIESTIVRSGAHSLKINATSGVAAWANLVIAIPGYIRFYICVTVLPSSVQRVIFGSTTTINLRLNPNGSIEYYNATTSIGTSTTRLTDTTRFYRIEVRQANGSSVPVLRIDGSTEVVGSPSTWPAPSAIGASGTEADACTVYFDDLIVNNSQFPDPGKVILLTATGDSLVTNWTRGGGSTNTGLWQSVSALPPPGVASANETDSTNIESASSSGSAAYAATIAAYSSGGIQASDKINAIQIVLLHGEDIQTGTKTGTVELTSNPIVNALTLGAAGNGVGSDAGAHGLYANTNSSSNHWSSETVAGQFIDNPSVVIGSSPVMKVIKTDVTTRVACVCFMGIYVDYTPANENVNMSSSPQVGAGIFARLS